MGKPERNLQQASTSQSFFWHGLLIFLPLVVLASAGLWSLRGQRQAIEQQARQDAADSASAIATQIADGIQAQFLEEARWLPRPVPLHPDDEEFPYLYPLNPTPPDDLIPDQLYRAAIGNAAELDALLKEYPDARAASGVPLAPLIVYQQFLAAPENKRQTRLQSLIKSAVDTHASIISEPLLAEASPAALRDWELQAPVRRVLRANIASIRSVPSSRWFDDPETGRWRIEIVNDPKSTDHPIVCALRQADLNFTPAPPPGMEYASFEITYDGVPVFPRKNPPVSGKQIASARDGAVGVTAFLTDTEKLYRPFHRQTTWFIGIIAASAITAFIGLWVTRRAFLKQQAINRMKSNFVSSVSHELRAPIASIRLLAERLRSGKVEEKAKRGEYFGFIEQESRRLATLVENVLDFSRIEDGRKTYRFEETDIEQLATETVQLMMPHASEKKITIVTDFHPPEKDPSIDPMEIQQALINLIDNAIKYSPEAESITVGLSNDPPEKFQLWVQDQGPGIEHDEQQKIFQRFYRIGSELERETQGVGIGLAIVRHTAEAHGGAIIVKSAPGKGSRFTLELPVAR